MRRRSGVRAHAAPSMLLCAALSFSVLVAGSRPPAATAAAASSRLAVRGSVGQVQVTGAPPGARVELFAPRSARLRARRADPLGAALFAGLPPGSGYHVLVVHGARRVRSAGVTVLSGRAAPPDPRIYDRRIPSSGYGYLTTRDGTKLAIDIRLPDGGHPPYPTLVEYSGYGYANPAGAESGISAIATRLGYAVVDVNMRGTGCSGGAFDLFSRLSNLDGYDVIETVAHQPWVQEHKVGMIGISFGGISQLFVAATQPPDLEAIAPLSVVDSFATVLAPGGILNTGFALSWVKDRVHDARPASPTGGQAWALQRIAAGDQVCRANQALHAEAQNLLAKVRASRFYNPAVADPLSPVTFVKRITVPVYLACQWTDEQTGGHCPALVSRFTGTRRKWFTFTNGLHIDSFDPAVFTRWYDFLALFVAHRAPRPDPAIAAAAPGLYEGIVGLPGVQLPPDPIQAAPSYAAALASFERLARVRILFDNGAGPPAAGSPVATFERSFGGLPVPGTKAVSWYLGAAGTLRASPPAAAGGDEFTWDKQARPATDFSGDTESGPGGLWTATPAYQWTQSPPGTALSYVTPPLSRDVAVIGTGAVRLWLHASVPDVDLQVTVSEVRPDGKETFVQTGWLRASERRLDPRRSTALDPVPSFRRSDVAPLPSCCFSQVTVPLYYEGHMYRRGSRIRIIVQAPSGDQPVWAFAQTTPPHPASVLVARSRRMPSRLVLPVVPGFQAPTPLPPCPSLRGEPCRDYRPLVNRSVTSPRLSG